MSTNETEFPGQPNKKEIFCVTIGKRYQIYAHNIGIVCFCPKIDRNIQMDTSWTKTRCMPVASHSFSPKMLLDQLDNHVLKSRMVREARLVELT